MEQCTRRIQSAVAKVIVALAAVFVVGLCLHPACAWADDPSDADQAVTRGEWLHKLVEAFEVTVEDENYPEEYFSDVTEDSPYYLDFVLAAEFGIIDVPAGEALRPDDDATREFMAHTLNFCMGYQLDQDSYSFKDADECQYPDDDQIAVDKKWLLLAGDMFLPEKSITSEEADKAIADEKEVWLSTRIEDDHENVVVVKPGVKEIPEDVSVKQVSDNVLEIADSSVSLNKGDVFLAVVVGIPGTYKAMSVEVKGEALRVRIEKVDFDNAVEKMDYQTETPFDLTAMSNEASGGLSTQAVDDFKPGVDVKTSFTKDSVSASGTIKTAGTDDTGFFDQTAGNEASIEASATNLKQRVGISPSGAFLVVTGDLNVEASAKGSMSFSAPLYKTPTYPIDFSIDLDLSCSGSASAKSTSGFVAGFQVTPLGYVRAVKEFARKHFEQTIDASMSLEVKASVNYDAKLSFKGSVYAKFGVGAKAKLVTYDEGLPKKCLSLAIYLKSSLGVSGSFSLGAIKVSISYAHTIWDVSNSPVKISKHIEDGVRVKECTRGSDDFITELESKANQYFDTSITKGANSTPTWDYLPTRDNTAKIVRYKGGASSVQVPASIQGRTVTAVGKSSFIDTPAKSVQFPDTVATIEANALSTLQNVLIRGKKVSITDTLTLTACKLVTAGSISCSGVRLLEGSSLNVYGDASMQLYEMSGKGGALIVHGDFRNSTASTNVSDGRLVFYGDVATGGHFGSADSNSEIVFCGSGTQHITSHRESYNGTYVRLGNVKVNNPDVSFSYNFDIWLAGKMRLDGDLAVHKLETRGYDMDVAGNLDVLQLNVTDGSDVLVCGTLETAPGRSDPCYSNTVTCDASTIVVKGGIVTKRSGGKIALSNGSRLETTDMTGLTNFVVVDSNVVVNGNFNSTSQGSLSMNGMSRVDVHGDARTYQIGSGSQNCIMHVDGSLTASSGFWFGSGINTRKGVIEIGGDLTIDGYYGYYEHEGHMTVLCGTGPQQVTIKHDFNRISNVVIARPDKEGVTGIPKNAKVVHDPDYATGDRYIAFACIDTKNFDGSVQSASPRYGDETLLEGEHYSVKAGAGTFYNAGNQSVTLEGIAPYKGTADFSYYVYSATMSKAVVEDIPAITFDGEYHTPSLSISYNGYSLAEGKDKDYTLSYSQNRNAGRARVTVTGRGNYSGTLTKFFDILPTETAQPVVDLIDAIGDVTLDSEQGIVKARAAYDNLSAFDKDAVSNLSTLTQAETKLANLKKAKAVDDLIAGIGEIESLDSEPAVKNARSAYNALSAVQRKLVELYDQLVAAESAIFELSHVWSEEWSYGDSKHWRTCDHCDQKKDYADHEAGLPQKENEVEATCEGEGHYDLVTYCKDCGKELACETVTVPALGHEYHDSVVEPTEAEDGFTEHVCTRCGDRYADARVDSLAKQRDKAAAEAAAGAIAKLPTEQDVTLDDAGAVSAAREAYEALTVEQRAFVPEDAISSLKTLEACIADLQAKADEAAFNHAAAAAFEEEIAAIPDSASLTFADAGRITSARESYESLTDEQKALVPAEAVDALARAEKRIAALRAAADKAEADASAVKGVSRLIAELPAAADIALSDAASVSAARKAYDALSADQKKLVPEESLKALASAEARVGELLSKNANPLTISASNATFVYDGKAHGVVAVASDASAAVLYGAKEGDYSQKECPEFTDAGTYTIYIMARRAKVAPLSSIYSQELNYTTASAQLSDNELYDYAYASVELTINKRSVADALVELSAASFSYDGKPHQPKASVSVADMVLRPGVDYSISYKDNVEVGTARSIIRGEGNFDGEIESAFEIASASGRKTGASSTVGGKSPKTSIAKAKVRGLKTRVYTGRAIKQSFAVKLGKTTLKMGVDYVVAYKRNVKAGLARIVVKGKGKYSGVRTVRFRINKAKQPLVAKLGKTKINVKAAKAKKRTITLKNPIIVKKAIGSVVYKNASKSKALKKLKVNAKTGNVRVPKGTKRGVYKLKMTVIAKGNANFKRGSKALTVRLVVK